MPALTEEQARSLAKLFFGLSKSIGDFQFNHFDEIPPAAHGELNEVKHRLSDASIHFTALAIGTSLEELAPVLARIETVTKKATAAVKKLNDVRRVLSVAAAAVTLSGAILAGDAGGIAEAIGRVFDAVQPQAGGARG